MKSIVEEASSIVKAIEKAWIRAGKPVTFQVKVLEEPKRNFLGMTVKSAKIGLFFTETQEVRQPVRHEPRRERRISVGGRRETTSRREPVARREPVREPIAEKKVVKKPRVLWTPEMVVMAKDWLQKSLATMNRADIPFSIATKGYHLRILFGRPLFEDRAKEQQVFKNFAYLMMQLLRTKFKKGFAGFKVVLKST